MRPRRRPRNGPRSPGRVGRLVAAALLLVLGLAAGCGGRGDGPAAGGEPVHVHGLGVNPADGALYIATHTGLFRMERGEDDAERVGDRRQDTMGFTVVGPDHFLGSGHPDLRDDLPPLLGLIESRDRGRSWQSVSMLGVADFHVLRANGAQVLGYDATGQRVLRSGDGGENWIDTRPPAPLLDVAMHPAVPRRLVAATERGLIASSNGGGTWRGLGRGGQLLAWPRADALYALSADGSAAVSRDGGATWATAGRLPGPPAALTADADRLVVALHDGGFVNSMDGARTWTPGAWP